jgi:hypothetical protein
VRDRGPCHLDGQGPESRHREAVGEVRVSREAAGKHRDLPLVQAEGFGDPAGGRQHAAEVDERIRVVRTEVERAAPLHDRRLEPARQPVGGPASPAGPGDQAGQPVELTPVAPTAEWPASSPAAEGLDALRLTDVKNRVRRREYGSP